jgi:prenyltransferase beta subunit
MPTASRSFVANALKDAEHGGYFAVIDSSGQVPICSDKRLEDQVAAARFYGLFGNQDEASFALQGLVALQDNANAGFHELSDRYFTPHGSGRCRTLAVQMSALRVLLEVGRAATDPVPAVAHITDALIGQLQQVYQKPRLSAVYSADWSQALDNQLSLENDIQALELAVELCRSGRGDTLVSLMQQHVWRIEDEVKAHLQNQDESVALLRCDTRARAVTALARWAKANHNQETLALARALLGDTLEVFHDATYGGFWDRIKLDRTVGVDWHTSFARYQSPFPVKTSQDVALLALAYREVHETCDATTMGYLYQALSGFYDSRRGGFFIGKGYFWSTAKDHTVPFIRQFWAPPRDMGVFHIGNLSYLPLHVKRLEGQFACMEVLERITDLKPLPPKAPHVLTHCVEGPQPGITRTHLGAVPHLPINLPAYLEWLQSARASLTQPYGLTAELAPLGYRADRAWQVFSALHVISDLRALDVPLQRSESLTACIQASQNPDGGFSEQPGQLSDVFATYCALVSLKLMDAQPLDADACARYLGDCQNEEGGFGNVPGYPSDIWHTNLALLSLHVLQAQVPDQPALLEYVMSCKTPSGGFGNQPGNPPDTFSTYRAISLLHILNKALPSPQQTVKWLQDLQQPGGGFLYRPDKVVSLVGTYMAIAALFLLDAQPRELDSVTDWISRHQKADGGFGPLNAPSATTDESFTCIQSLLILKGVLSPYWVALVN